MPQESLKILMYSMDGYGHLHASVGMAQELANRGHKIHFLLNEVYKGQVAKYGFEEFLLKKSSAKQATDMMLEEDEEEEEEDEIHEMNPLKQLANKRKALGMFSSKTPLQNLQSQNNAAAMLKEMYDSLVDYHPQMGYAIARLNPDLTIVDTYLIPVAVLLSGLPWVNLCSLNPLSLHNSDKLPPFGSGYSTKSNPSSWRLYKSLLNQKNTKVLAQYQKKLFDRFYYKPTAAEMTQHGMFFASEYLNVYAYPSELDYNEPLESNYIRVDAFNYKSTEIFKLPKDFLQDQKLIFFSLGSEASLDVELMKRITTMLGKSKHKYIVSKGPRADEYELPSNCCGAPFLPQTEVLPLVDLVITHGGNNTTTETFAQGKPMLVLPIYGDQYDNAQRIAEKGYGLRLEPYTLTEDELLGAIDRLLADEEIIQRANAAARRIEMSKSKAVACEQIENLVYRFRNGL